MLLAARWTVKARHICAAQHPKARQVPLALPCEAFKKLQHCYYQMVVCGQCDELLSLFHEGAKETTVSSVQIASKPCAHASKQTSSPQSADSTRH